MFKINKVEPANFYMDKVMADLQSFALKARGDIESRFESSRRAKDKTSQDVNLDKRKDLELEKIRYINEKLHNLVKDIIKRFPNFKKVDKIYLRLVDTSDVKVAEIEDALKRLLWITNTIDEYTQNTEVKIKHSKSQQTVSFIMKKYLGRVNSLFRKNKDFFVKLEMSRQFMNRLPTFLEVYTVAIGGYPNVGKSTLLKKITGSNVEIQNYPFTTKGLMFGYLESNGKKEIQFIDTPGLLGREKSNPIEQRAEIVLNEYSDFIVFVLDLTKSSGYSVKSQIRLLKQTLEIGKPLIIYLSKTDIYDEDAEMEQEEIKSVLKKHKTFTDALELKEYVLTQKFSVNKFDVRKINTIK